MINVLLLQHWDDAMQNGFACWLLQGSLGNVIAVDHGHRSSDGTSNVSIYLKPVPITAVEGQVDETTDVPVLNVATQEFVPLKNQRFCDMWEN